MWCLMFWGEQMKRKGDQLVPPGITPPETGLGMSLAPST
jgi:hypothetical protein